MIGHNPMHYNLRCRQQDEYSYFSQHSFKKQQTEKYSNLEV